MPCLCLWSTWWNPQARGVLQWKNSSSEESLAIWSGLADSNSAISRGLGELCEASKVGKLNFLH